MTLTSANCNWSYYQVISWNAILVLILRVRLLIFVINEPLFHGLCGFFLPLPNHGVQTSFLDSLGQGSNLWKNSWSVLSMLYWSSAHKKMRLNWFEQKLMKTSLRSIIFLWIHFCKASVFYCNHARWSLAFSLPSLAPRHESHIWAQ